MQLELKALQEEVGITFIYVTQTRMRPSHVRPHRRDAHGRIQQEGPRGPLRAAGHRFVANFMGVSNLIAAELLEHDPSTGRAVVESDPVACA